MENNRIRRYILDTSFVLACFISEDINHTNAQEKFLEIDDTGIFFMNELTYTELLTVANYKL